VKKVKTAGDYSIYQKRSGRYAVRDQAKKWVNAEDKTKVLLDAGLIKVSEAKPAPREGTEESSAEETASAEEGGEGSES